ncbi:MAG: fused MFS/spermidine synthase [bacterium]
MILFLFFFLSGTAALIYETLWLKELGLLFGNTADAAATTLAVFFLGLALGSWYFGRRAQSYTRPLRIYGLLEIGIAATGLLYFALNPLFQAIYGEIYPQLGQFRPAITAIKFLLAVFLLCPPAILMGGTLPIMGQHLIRHREDLGRKGTLLYLVNTLGAVTGAFLAGFILPAKLGFSTSYAIAIVLSLAVGVAALLWARSRPESRAPGFADNRESLDPDAAPVIPPAFIRALAFLSGFLILGLEVLWTRILAQVLHNSVYSFAAILVVFLLSLTLGSLAANTIIRLRSFDPRRVIAGAGILTCILLAVSAVMFVQATDGLVGVPGGGGWSGYVARIFLLAGSVILLPGTVAGTIYPYLLKVSEGVKGSSGRILGNLASVNSVGGILGSLVTGFVVLAKLGIWSSLFLIASGYLGLAVLSFSAHLGRRTVPLAAAITAMGLALLTLGMPDLPVTRVEIAKGERLVALDESRYGTVAVIAHEGLLYLKLDSHYSLGGTGAVDSERRQAQLPLIISPRTDSVFFLGLGSGITAGGATDFPLQRIVACELIPAVVEGAKSHFRNFTGGLFEDPRVRVLVENGRHFLAGSRESFDLIISDLFVPWHAGTGSLYTLEHFRNCRDRLNEGGHFALWVPATQMSRSEFDILARTILEVFPQVTVWRGEFLPDWPTLLFMCSSETWRLDPSLTRANTAPVIPPRPGGKVSDADIIPYIHYVGNLGEARSLFAGSPVNTDDRPHIEYGAPQTQQRVLSEEARFLEGREIVKLSDDLLEAAPLVSDPFLGASDPEQLSYIQAGHLLYRVGTLLEDGMHDEAAFLYKEFLAIVPFDIFPDLKSR